MSHSSHNPTHLEASFLQSSLKAAATRTYRMAVRYGLSPAEREDLQQELRLDLLEHQEKFDPAKGSLGTFTGMVSQHRSVEFLDQLIKDRSRLSFIGHLDPDDHGEADDEPIAEIVDTDEKNVVLMWADDRDLFSDSDALRDLETAISYMSDEQAGMFELLEAHQDLPSACRASGVSTATFYRRVADLQMHLRMFGFKSAA